MKNKNMTKKKIINLFEKNKRGIFGWDSTLTIIVGVVVMIVLLIIAGQIFLNLKKDNPDQLCSTNSFLTSTTSIAGKTVFDFKCPVRQWAFDIGRYGEIPLGETEPKDWFSAPVKNPKSLKWFQPFTGNYELDVDALMDFSKKVADDPTYTKEKLMNNMEDVSSSGDIKETSSMRETVYAEISKNEKKYMTMDQQDFMNGVITKRMYQCVKKLGEGKLNIFDSWYTAAGKNSFCVVCDTFDFSRLSDSKKLPNDFFIPDGFAKSDAAYDEYDIQKGTASVSTLDNWMRLWQPPEEGMNFYNYFLKFNTEDTYFTSRSGNNLKYTMFEKDSNTGEIMSYDYAIVYIEANDPVWMQGINNVINDNEKQKFILGGVTVGGAVGCLGCVVPGAGIGALVGGVGAVPGAAVGCVFCGVTGGVAGGVGGLSIETIKNAFGKKTDKNTAHGIYFVPVTAVPNMCDHVVNY